ncbi:PEP-CTERM sorting domain-containing protein [Corallincola luteus]|nr:PEP-CTERM sorting domain-containing protein [Corallincola luteus]
MRSLLTRFIAVFALVAATNTAQAALLDYTFTFENALNGGGTVTGIVRGLTEGTSAASSVEVFSNTAGFGVGEYVGSPVANFWTVAGGIITDFEFVSFGVVNSAPAVTDSTLLFRSAELNGTFFRAGLSDAPNSVTSGSALVSTEDISLSFAPASAAVPAPAPIALLGLALVGLVLRRRAS